MSKLQCIVTSYCRPKYLKPCLESMRQDDIELYVVDGGSDEPTKDIIRSLTDDYIFLSDNPGADVLKNQGIDNFVTNPEFVVSSDDYIFPKRWSQEIVKQYVTLNKYAPIYAMMASPTELVIARHTQDIGVSSEYGVGVGKHYIKHATGLDIMPVSYAMVAGTIMNTAAVKRVGGFPVYGKTGQGDLAISSRLRKLGYVVGYLRNPVLKHIGHDKKIDYPEYTADFAADDAIWYERARNDDWKP